MANIEQYEKKLNGWRLGPLIGSGGVGEVYEINRGSGPVSQALKIIHIEFPENIQANSAEKKRYLENAARDICNAVADSQDQRIVNVVRCYDQEYYLGENFVDILIRMERLQSLKERIEKHGLTEDEVIKIGLDIGKALDSIHRLGIVHRDIKPGNILYDRDNRVYKLTDFDTAIRYADIGRNGRAGSLLTMSPEMLNDRGYGFQSDIYSLGMTLYLLLNRFRNDPPGKRMRERKIGRPKFGSSKFVHVIRKACAYDPEDRFRSAKRFCMALEEISIGSKTRKTVVLEKQFFTSHCLRGEGLSDAPSFGPSFLIGTLSGNQNLSGLYERTNRLHGMQTDHYIFLNEHTDAPMEKSSGKEQKTESSLFVLRHTYRNFFNWFFFTFVVSLVPTVFYFLCKIFVIGADASTDKFTHEFVFFAIVLLTTALKGILFGECKRVYRYRVVICGGIAIIALIVAFCLFALIIVSETVQSVNVNVEYLHRASIIICIASIVLGGITELMEDSAKWTERQQS